MKLKKLKNLLSEAQIKKTEIAFINKDCSCSLEKVFHNSNYKILKQLEITQIDVNENGYLMITVNDTAI